MGLGHPTTLWGRKMRFTIVGRFWTSKKGQKTRVFDPYAQKLQRIIALKIMSGILGRFFVKWHKVLLFSWEGGFFEVSWTQGDFVAILAPSGDQCRHL